MDRSKMLRFPWPDSRLSPNSRKDRRYLTDVRTAAHQVGFAITCDAGLMLPMKGDLCWRLVFCPPDGRHRDDDNVYASFKSARDGIFAALETNDARIRRTVIEWGEVEVGGAVYVEIMELKTAEYVEYGLGK